MKVKREREKRSGRGRKRHRIIQDHLSQTVVQEKVKGLDGGKNSSRNGTTLHRTDHCSCQGQLLTGLISCFQIWCKYCPSSDHTSSWSHHACSASLPSSPRASFSSCQPAVPSFPPASCPSWCCHRYSSSGRNTRRDRWGGVLPPQTWWWSGPGSSPSRLPIWLEAGGTGCCEAGYFSLGTPHTLHCSHTTNTSHSSGIPHSLCWSSRHKLRRGKLSAKTPRKDYK